MAGNVQFTHKGWLCGLVPVLIANPYSDCPMLKARWWWLEFVMDGVEAMFSAYATVRMVLQPNYEPLFPIRITGEV